MAAEKELAAAKRSGNNQRISDANDRLTRAKAAQSYKKAEISATKEYNDARAKRERIEKAVGNNTNSTELKEAREQEKAAKAKLDSIQKRQQREGSLKGAQTNVQHQALKEDIEAMKREQHEAAVTSARQRLENAKATGNVFPGKQDRRGQGILYDCS